ncbi:hypothetical protein ACQUQU_17335 [Thalassolituus sp. LLYu03]|uniref:MSCRAMM family protein n=1 Tax=Thalassolituus sp. LLYu03 TaxID=3421656 RepID=UPI003D2C433C
MQRLLTVFLAAALSACGGSGNSTGDDNSPDYSPATTSISSLTLVDAAGQPLANASVTVSEAVTAQATDNTGSKTTSLPAGFVLSGAVTAQADQTLSTDSNGHLLLNDLAPGRYILTITVKSVTVTTTVVIGDDNASDSTTIAAPVVVNGDEASSLQNPNGSYFAIFASVSGVVYDAKGPLAGAQVELSGGLATNGAVAKDITDANGRYLLVINVSLSKLEALRSATLSISKAGYVTKTITFDSSSSQALVGVNYGLVVTSSDNSNGSSGTVLYSEDFEQLSNGAVCGSWISADLPDELNGDQPDNQSAQAVAEKDDSTLLNLWHAHQSGLNLSNHALAAADNLVKLAPDDGSAGRIPEPADQFACWYGQGSGDNVGTGNFIGEFEGTKGGLEQDGGTSDYPNGGAIESPALDFSALSAPLALTFSTWWEIESVNPNNKGYDLMIVQASTDGGSNWTTLARLNPLADPVSGEINRAPLPYSNRGFNRAPAWAMQEPIDISELAGSAQVKLRLEFRTVDNLYNAFRGWLVDDIQVLAQAGTFPRYDEDQWGEGEESDDDAEACLDDPQTCLEALLPDLKQ